MALKPMAMKLNDIMRATLIDWGEIFSTSQTQDWFFFFNLLLFISLGAVLTRPMYLLSHSD